MAFPVVSGASISCTMGASPGQLLVTSQLAVMMGGKPVATIQDAAPITNVCPCGMCSSLANPTVASATAAAMGVLTPMPCVPSPAGVWVSSPGPLIGGIPALLNDGKLMCAYGGAISIMMPAQQQVMT